MKSFILITLLLCFRQAQAQPLRGDAEKPQRLDSIAHYIGPPSRTNRVHASWSTEKVLMAQITAYDRTISRIQKTICKSSGNRSVLMYGASERAARLIVARISNNPLKNCNQKAHHVLSTSRLISGKWHVGALEFTWQKTLVKGLQTARSVLHVPDLAHLIGQGSHAHDDDGIEATYAQNLLKGDFASVAYISNADYRRFKHSRYAYVLNAFADTVQIPKLEAEQIHELVSVYSERVHHKSLSKSLPSYLQQLAEYYIPNRPEPDRSLALVQMAARQNTRAHPITEEAIRKAVLEYANVPAWLVEKDYQRLKQLRSELDKYVVGVENTKQSLVRLAQSGYVVTRPDEKPIASTLFAGPTGTGKTYIAKQFARIMGLPLIIFDMTSYKSPHQIEEFNHTLSRNLVSNPFAVYLFEEIDKASPEILDKLFFLMDEGRFFNDSESGLSGRGAFIIMTTNSGTKTILEHDFSSKRQPDIWPDLQQNFRLSFLNRFDAIDVFIPFSDAEFQQLATVLTQKRIEAYKKRHGWSVRVSDNLVRWFGKQGRSHHLGARPMERLIDKTMGSSMAYFFLNKKSIPRGANIKLSREPNGQIHIMVDGESLYFDAEETQSK